jgi:hypothetical protein
MFEQRVKRIIMKRVCLVGIVWLCAGHAVLYAQNADAVPIKAENDPSSSKAPGEEKGVREQIYLPVKKLPSLYPNVKDYRMAPEKEERKTEKKENAEKQKDENPRSEEKKIRDTRKGSGDEREEREKREISFKAVIQYKKHDVNNDRIVNSQDKVAVREFRNELRNAYGTNKKEYDLNNDGEVNAFDSDVVRSFLEEQNQVFCKEYTLKDEIQSKTFDVNKDGAVNDRDQEEVHEFSDSVRDALKTNDRRYDVNDDRYVDKKDVVIVKTYAEELNFSYNPSLSLLEKI